MLSSQAKFQKQNNNIKYKNGIQNKVSTSQVKLKINIAAANLAYVVLENQRVQSVYFNVYQYQSIILKIL